MKEDERDMLIEIKGDVKHIKEDMKNGATIFKDHDERIRNVEISAGAMGKVSILLLGAVGWLYRIMLGGK